MVTTDMPAPATALPSGRHSRAQLESLRHPKEPSRFALALVATGIVAAGFAAATLTEYGVAGLVSVCAGLALAGLSVWISLQVRRAHLLGQAARVSVDNLPQVQATLDQVRRQLNYDRRVDLYVTDEVKAHAKLVKVLSTRVILLDGAFVADSLSDDKNAELTFLLARFIGALKSKHLRLQPIMRVIESLQNLAFLNPFLYPYERTTVYSGDQIGLACCGDLRAALNVLSGFMVGTKLAPDLGVRGVLQQATSVRRKWLPRLRQLFLTHPHLTNRYLNLLEFAEWYDPAGFAEFQASLDPATDERLPATRLPATRTRADGAWRGRRTAALVAVVCFTLAIGVGLGWRLAPWGLAADRPHTDGVLGPGSVGATTTVPPEPELVELVPIATASASSTAPPARDAGGQPIDYAPSNVADGDPSTAWRTPGDGRGETLTLRWDHPVRVATIGLIPGYDKLDPYDGTDRFPQHRRITAARIHLSDGSALDVHLTDSRELQTFEMAAVTVSVTVEIQRTTPGDPGFDYTAVSEMSVIGGDA